MSADEKKVDPQVVMLTNVRLSFPTLVEAQASIENGKKNFSSNFLIDPSTTHGQGLIARVKKAIAAAEMSEFGETGKVKTIDDTKRICFRPGEKFKNADGDVYSGYEGMVGLTAKSKKRPILFDRHKRDVEIDDIEDVFVGGFYVDAKVRIYCTSKKDQGGRGLFASILAIRSRQEGEPFGAVNNTSADEFEDIEDEDGFGDEGGSDGDSGESSGGHSLLD